MACVNSPASEHPAIAVVYAMTSGWQLAAKSSSDDELYSDILN
jgi:hypothetical protein